jgi:hypothetical protein
MKKSHTSVSGLTRCYPSGGIGISFLCQFENPEPSPVPLTSLEAFNQNGLDAAIASPFSLAEVFEELRNDSGDLQKKNGQKADEAFELVIIGNPNLPICGRRV